MYLFLPRTSHTQYTRRFHRHACCLYTSEQLRWHFQPAFPLSFLCGFHTRCLYTFCTKSENRRKTQIRGPALPIMFKFLISKHSHGDIMRARSKSHAIGKAHARDRMLHSDHQSVTAACILTCSRQLSSHRVGSTWWNQSRLKLQCNSRIHEL